MAGLKITGWGTALPERVVTNEELAKQVDTNDEWISDRTGISERRIGGTTAGLGADAGRMAMERAGVDPSSIDLLILATTTPDRRVPATASTIQHQLGLDCGAFDLNAACSGFMYGLTAAHGFMRAGMERILIIGAETLSVITDWTDRNTCILFADGAGAVVVDRTDDDGDVLSFSLSSDGSLEDVLYCDHGGFLEMNGREVFRKAVLVMEKAGREALKQAGLEASDIDHVIPHQANIRIIEASMKRLGIPMDKAIHNLHCTGNTSSASIPLAMVNGIDEGRIHERDLVLMVGFGAGMTSAAAVVRWSVEP